MERDSLSIFVLKLICLPTLFQEEKTRGKVADFEPNMIMLGLSPSDYVLRALSNINANDLEQTLLVLSIVHVIFSSSSTALWKRLYCVLPLYTSA